MQQLLLIGDKLPEGRAVAHPRSLMQIVNIDNLMPSGNNFVFEFNNVHLLDLFRTLYYVPSIVIHVLYNIINMGFILLSS